MQKSDVLEQLDQWQRFQREAVDGLFDLGVPVVELMQLGARVADARQREWQAKRAQLALSTPAAARARGN